MKNRLHFAGVHSVLNKVTGMLLLLLPLSLPLVDIRYSGYAVCLVATIAAIQEGHTIRERANDKGGKNE